MFGVNIDGQEVTAQRIDSVIDGLIDVRFHWEATTERVNRLREGGPATTLCSEDSARLFGFGQNLSTAAFLRSIAPAQAPSIPWNELTSSLQTVGAIPSRDELEEQRPELKKLAEYRGLRRLFRSRPQAQIDTYRRYAAIDSATVHSVLTGVDAALGSTDRGQFLGIDLAAMRPAITAELEKLTGWVVHWHQPAEIDVHRQALTRLAQVEATEKSLLAQVESQQRALKTKLADAELRQTDIQILDQLTPSTSLRLGPLQHLNLLDIEAATVSDLTRYDGVGEQTARQAIAAAKRYAAEMRADQPAVIDYRDKGPSTAYVRALAELLQFREERREANLEGPFLALPEGVDASAQGVSDYALARPADGPHLITQAELTRIPTRGAPLSAEQAWNLYAIRAAEFHAFGDDKSATAVPEDIAKSIEEITLRGVLHASLRGYQDFGARYALAQRKVLIGDEMGLGKTMQALAVFAHLAARGEKHFVVICPPSLRINWQREIQKFTDLEPHIIAGPYKDAAYEAFSNRGGIAIVGFPEVRGDSTVMTGDLKFGALVVDEAHRAKNPKSKQAQGVQQLTARTDVVTYLSGTPLENRVSEMETLLGYLDPELEPKLEKARRSAREFRNVVARRYLRRNQSDVLAELPPLTETEEWIEAREADREKYNEAVEAGNFMQMRQSFSGPESAKMERFAELLTDGLDDDKTIVFTYFRGVLNHLMDSLGDRAFGPIAGGVSHQERQQAVDDFTAAEPGAVLVAQINAASEGLNIQAANHVVLIEPQLNPAIEAQAIARAHRMGQINPVEVHRLLTPDSVEERLHLLLATKRELFDSYARDSVAAQQNPEAMDITDQQVMSEVLAAEKERIKALRGETPTL